MEFNKIVVNRNYQSIDDTARVDRDSDPQQCEKLPPSRLDCLCFERPATKWKLASLFLLPAVIVVWIQAGSHGTEYIRSPQMQNQLVMTSEEIDDDSSGKAYLQTDLAPQELMEVEQSDLLGVEDGMQEITIQEGDDESEVVTRIEKGTKATADMVKLIAGINTNNVFADPASTMDFFTDFVGVLEDFIPYGTLIGTSLQLIGSFFGIGAPDQPSDFEKLRKNFDDGMARIEQKIDDMTEKIGHQIGLVACNDQLDDTISKFLAPFQNAVNHANSSEDTDVLYSRMFFENTCGSADAPSNLLLQWSNMFDDGQGFLQCRSKLISDSNGRLFYFRKKYLQIIVSQVMRAVRFDGICRGFLSNSVASTVVERYVRDIQHGLAKMESEINKKMPVDTIAKNIPNPKDASDLYNTLIRDYSDEWSFGTFSYQIQKASHTLHTALSVLNTHNNRIGRVGIDVGGRRFHVFYKDKNIRIGRAMTADSWANTESSCNAAMCQYRKTNWFGNWCVTKHCVSAWYQLHENVRDRGGESYNLYRNRGVVLVRLNERRCTRECARPGCNGCCEFTPYCSWRSLTSGSVGEIYGDILTRFDFYEQQTDNWGYTYALIGLTN